MDDRIGYSVMNRGSSIQGTKNCREDGWQKAERKMPKQVQQNGKVTDRRSLVLSERSQ